MPAAAPLQSQQDIAETLREIDGHIRELARRTKKAKEVSGVCKEIQTCIEELKESKTTLQRHRAQVRKWVVDLGAKHEMKCKLGASRTRLEQELRGIVEAEKGLEVRLANAQPAESALVSPPSSLEQPASDGSSPHGSSPFDAGLHHDEVTLHGTEVKVLTSQLLDVGDLTEELVCKICHDVVGCEPKLSRCSHLFCGDCLAQWFVAHPANLTWAQRASSAGYVPCPVCKEKLHEQRDIFPVCEGGKQGSAFLFGMLQRTGIRCANHKLCRPGGACDWVGDYGTYQAHIRSCENIPKCVVPSSRVESDAKSAWSECELLVGRASTNSSTVPSDDGIIPDVLSTSEDDNTVGEGFTPEEQESPKLEAQPQPEVSSLLSSIGALLDLKIKAKARMLAEGPTCAELESGLADEATTLVTSSTDIPEKQPQKQAARPKPASPDKAIAKQEQQQHQHTSLSARARANQIAQWQHMQAAQRAYAAQWQAARWQAAYAGQWQAAHYAAQAAGNP